ncbi:MAG: hypothetical protein ACI9T7_000518 [Oleiphilaceae bacterium]
MKEIIITSLLTALLTATASILLIKFQTSTEQDYWEKRFSLERAEEILKNRIKYFEIINEGVLKSEVLVKNIKLTSSSFLAKLELCKNNTACTIEEAKSLNKQMVDYQLHLNVLASALQMVPVYYSSTVSNLVPQLSEALERNLNMNSSFMDRYSENEEKAISEYFEEDTDTIDELKKTRGEIIKAMMDDIAEYHDTLYNHF